MLSGAVANVQTAGLCQGQSHDGEVRTDRRTAWRQAAVRAETFLGGRAQAVCPANTLATKLAVAAATAAGESSWRKCDPSTVTVV